MFNKIKWFWKHSASYMNLSGIRLWIRGIMPMFKFLWLSRKEKV